MTSNKKNVINKNTTRAPHSKGFLVWCLVSPPPHLFGVYYLVDISVLSLKTFI